MSERNKEVTTVYYDIDKVRKQYPHFSEKKIETIAVYRTKVENLTYDNNYPYQHLELNLDFFDDLPIDVKIHEMTFFVHYYLGWLIMDNTPQFAGAKMHSKIITKELHNIVTKRVEIATNFLQIAPMEMRPQVEEFIESAGTVLKAKPMTVTRITEWMQNLNQEYKLKKDKAIKPLVDNLKRHIKN